MGMRTFYTLDRSCQKLEALSSMASVTRSRFQSIAAVLKDIVRGFSGSFVSKKNLACSCYSFLNAELCDVLNTFLRAFQEPLQADPSASHLAKKFLNESHRRSADLDELDCTKAFRKAI